MNFCTKLSVLALLVYAGNAHAASEPFLPIQERTGEEAIAAIENLPAEKRRTLYNALSKNTGMSVSEVRGRLARGDYEIRMCRPDEMINTTGFERGTTQLSYTQRHCRGKEELLIFMDGQVLFSAECGNPVRAYDAPQRAMQFSAESRPQERSPSVKLCHGIPTETVTYWQTSSGYHMPFLGWWPPFARVVSSTQTFPITQQGGMVKCPEIKSFENERNEE